MFSWASKPGEYVEGTTADRNSNLTNFSSHNLDPADFHSPGPGLATPPCLICPANHLFRHAHLSNNPICEGRGLFAGGGKEAPSSFPTGPPRGHFPAPWSPGVNLSMALFDPGTNPRVWGVIFAIPVLSLLFFHCLSPL